MKEFIMQETEEMTTFGSAWKRYEPVVELIRCKDCKWWDKKENSPYGYCHACKHGHYSEHWEIRIYRSYKGDWFCADAERKND